VRGKAAGMVNCGRAPTYPARVSSGLSSSPVLAGTESASPVPDSRRPAGAVPASPMPASPTAAGQRAIDAARLRVAVLRLSRRLRKHDLAGLTPSQLSTLSCVGKTGPVRLGDLAAAERIAPSTLTRLVNVLEDRGYLVRKPAPEDARAFLVTVTASGTEVLERIREEATSMLTDILATLTPDQLAALEAALPALEQLAGSG
jgi:DNA-binding MarR family transcriptional regulator